VGDDRAAAFFDLDKTLMAGSSGIHFGRAAARNGLVTRRQMARWGLDHLRFRLRGATDEQVGALMAELEETLQGVPVTEVANLFPELMAGVLPRVYPQMIEEVRAHQDAGRKTFIVSSAGNEIVEMLAHVLNMEGGIGTRYEVAPDGKTLTGKVDGPFIYGEGKVEAMRDFAEQHDLDLGASWAYSDSASDLPMLRAVGNPVAVNPDAPLEQVATEEGWQILRFERLGRKLAAAGAVTAAFAVGGSGTWLASRRNTPQRRIRMPRLPVRR
jgi:HAD superfamily hydrolase (TIGR01490 family)